MNEVVIRPARAADLPRIAAIEDSGAETFTAYGRPLADGSPPATPDYWAPNLAAGLLWIADDAEEGPIGFLAASVTEDGLYVAEVDVVMARQRQGHGRRLLTTAIAAARDRKLAALTLTTFRDIPWNAPFYASMGFVEVEPEAMSTHLATQIASEVGRGFTGRCAMRLSL